MLKKFFMKSLAFAMSLVFIFLLASCGAAGSATVVNIGMTYPLSSFNPLHIDASESMKYAIGISFEPIVELNENLEFEGVLADSVEVSDDSMSFTVKLKEEAKWSDGEPITADDVIFFVLKSTSKTVSNVSMAGYYLFKGFDESGQVADDATEVEGLEKVDDKTVIFHAKEPMSLENFNNNYMRYLFPIPSHVLKDMSTSELANSEWFNTAEVVSGPFKPTKVDLAHFVTYEKNQKYWQGEPKLSHLNIKIVTSSNLYSGLETGEIDYVQQTTGVFAQEDKASIEALETVEAVYDVPVTSVFSFINVETVPDPRVRQAILYAIDRETLVQEFLKGNGEVVDGFLTSASQYFDPNQETIPYNLEKAQSLMKEAIADGWDADKTLTFKIDSGDTTYGLAATVIVQQLDKIGVKAQLETVTLNQLLADAGKHDFDIMSVQYTLPPAAPALDIAWLTGEGNWSNYQDAEVDKLNLKATAYNGDEAGGIEIYSAINKKMQEDVPMFNTYALAPLGARSKRLQAPNPTVFGGFMNLHNWEIVK